MEVTVLGIRHHGPGSARSVRAELERLRPDAVLIEGPPEADAIIGLAAADGMRPPVALLAYLPDDPGVSSFYPFASFSPEWQAVTWALEHDVPVRFIDLPAANTLAQRAAAAKQAEARLAKEAAAAAAGKAPEGAGPLDAARAPEGEGGAGGSGPDAVADVATAPGPAPAPAPAAAPAGEPPDAADYAAAAAAAGRGDEEPDDGAAPDAGSPDPVEAVRADPLGWLARAAGYDDAERWWEDVVEQRLDGAGAFAAITEAMGALREQDGPLEPREAQREAAMRQGIRKARRDGFVNAAVVCGAWHAPALTRLPSATADAALLKGLPKARVSVTWVPWTHGRLALASGYGAGISSPGWYEHLFSAPDQPVTRWLTRVGALLREEGLDASSASVIEAVRLADALATLRGRPLAGLDELDEAAKAVLGEGSDVVMTLIRERLVVGETIGHVPDDTPMVPLARDLAAAQKRLRLKPDPVTRQLDLDLRKPNELARSHLLHRLNLLEVPWGMAREAAGGKGTFRELWELRWDPELSVSVIEAALWGTTVAGAATSAAMAQAGRAADLGALTGLLERCLLADLPDAIAAVMTALADRVALDGDVAHLMDALPPLARVVRYGDVRRTDTSAVSGIVDGVVIRVCIGLGQACAALDDDAARDMLDRVMEVHRALRLLDRSDLHGQWLAALLGLAGQAGLHGLLAGRCTRLLLEAGRLEPPEAARRLELALSAAEDPARAAAWVEGLLAGSGLLLIHDETLLGLLDRWLAGVPDEVFTDLLPLLRRTFSTFSGPEQRQIGERVARLDGAPRTGPAAVAADPGLDEARVAAALPLVAALLGLAEPAVPGKATVAPTTPAEGHA
jgi:hypothetical protein